MYNRGRIKKIFIGWGRILAVTYLGLGLGLRFCQTRLMFFPPSEISTTPADVNLAYEEVWIGVKTGKIHGWWIPAAKKTAPVLLYLHGNSSNIGDAVHRVDRLHQLGLSVLLIDYRGYGKSTGPFPKETRLYEDAEAAFHYLIHRRNIAPANIFVYGHSLGGAIAIELAVRHPQMAGAIVEATFTSMGGMVDHVMPYEIFPRDGILTQKFASLTKVRSLQIPILFIHGMEDKTIPVQMSRTLFAAAPAPKKLLLVPAAGHNNAAKLSGRQYLQAIQEFVRHEFD